jgi:SAM-dependent methyltransferase
MNSPSNARCCSDDCCSQPVAPVTPDSVREKVRDGYSKIAQSASTDVADAKTTSCCSTAGGGCCGPATFTPSQLASAIGYSQADLAGVPDTANLGLSCGNPTALAGLRPGEHLLDLGAGAGLDCFVAGPRLGPAGRAIGVDMTAAMIARSRAALAGYRARTGLDNVEFRLGEIEHLPVADASIDVVISNCVVNLSPDKPRVWREIARVLKPGGRVAVSDLALLRPLPEAVLKDVEALIGCVAGAVLVEDTRRMCQAAGLTDIVLTPKPEYIRAMGDWQDPLYRRIAAALPEGSTMGDYITSLDVSARKAAR